ncbi:bifunctional (p)ppGpp synthetase/guanosine-3',5'-bis(diphosphate) 3'-pyrophosphohydrolase [Candidatus Peregrinibacteria bacterium]|nr:bifunctional (p)ppGpp synthetase/guanosine-3',5'-bis(diphosphate) 3'-pyrophosphohydrolase [Candidatus Peregrinibacteria bacterium]
MENILGGLNFGDNERVQRALHIAKDTDSNCLNALEIISPMHPDEDTVIALLVKDAYLTGKIKAGDIEDYFGKSVMNIVSGVKRLESLNYSENDRGSQFEVLRKMFLAMAKDMRVVIIGMVDMLCDLMKCRSPDIDKCKILAKEALNLYVPIAERFGIYGLKMELEDFAFKIINRYDYDRVSGQLDQIKQNREISISFIKEKLENFFKEHGFEVEVSGRVKGIYSIYKKMIRKNLPNVLDLYDVFAMRVVLPVKLNDRGEELFDHLYSALGMIHSEWKPISKKFKDYIAVPKSNGYKSLHTVVLGLARKDWDQPVEVQIRSDRMHDDAEYGIASHWVYKQYARDQISNLQSQSEWIAKLESIKESIEGGIDAFKGEGIDVFKDKIFVLTPRGAVKDLPAGSCPIDFAYAVHSNIGNRCVMAKVNNKIVPLDYELKNGEVVEIVTIPYGTPKLQWLSIAKTNSARARIKAYFSALDGERNIKEGKELINSYLSRFGKPPLDQKYSVLKRFCGKNLNLSQRESLVEEVGKGGKMASDIVRKVYPYEELMSAKIEKGAEVVSKKDFSQLNADFVTENQILIGGEGGLPVKLLDCCDPKIGDNIVGYVTSAKSVSIHKTSCPMLGTLNGERLIYADWKGFKKSLSGTKYIVGIKVIGVSRIGFLSDVTSIISNMGINIRDIAIRKGDGGFYENCFSLEFSSLDQFDVLVDKLEAVKGVIKVAREEKK